MAKLADHIDGSEVGDQELVEKLIRCAGACNAGLPPSVALFSTQRSN